MSHPVNSAINENLHDEFVGETPACSSRTYKYHLIDLLSKGKCQMCGKKWEKAKVEQLLKDNGVKVY